MRHYQLTLTHDDRTQRERDYTHLIDGKKVWEGGLGFDAGSIQDREEAAEKVLTQGLLCVDKPYGRYALTLEHKGRKFQSGCSFNEVPDDEFVPHMAGILFRTALLKIIEIENTYE